MILLRPRILKMERWRQLPTQLKQRLKKTAFRILRIPMWKTRRSKYSPSTGVSRREKSIRPENTISGRLHTPLSPSRELTEDTKRPNRKPGLVLFREAEESCHQDQCRRHNPSQNCLPELINMENRLQKCRLDQCSRESLLRSLPQVLFKEGNLV